MPAEAVPHKPLTVAPSGVEHAWHDCEHVELQQKPSTQLPVTHARHDATLQSAAAARLHADPCNLRATQAPAALQ